MGIHIEVVYSKIGYSLNDPIKMKLNIAIMFGGKSAEHEISLQSASNIINAVDRSLFTPILLGIDKNGDWFYNPNYNNTNVNLTKVDYFLGAKKVFILKQAQGVEIIDKGTIEVLAKFEIVFPIIHGAYGEDGTLQGFLKMMDIPFVGPNILSSSIAMDKDIAKRLFRDAGIPIANFYTIYSHSPEQYSFEEIITHFGIPFFIKPANAGSSIGVSKVRDKKDFEKAIIEVFKYDKKALIEEAVLGKEIECAVLGNDDNIQASVIGEIIPTLEFYSYDAKYINPNGANFKIPADVNENTSNKIRELSIKAFKAIQGEGMARIDFFLREDNSFVLNEINTLPGFTQISMYPKLWEYMGVQCKDLITILIDLSVQKNKYN